MQTQGVDMVCLVTHTATHGGNFLGLSQPATDMLTSLSWTFWQNSECLVAE